MESDAYEIETFWLEDDGSIPNNPDHPLLVYKGVIPTVSNATDWCRRRLSENGWGGTWVDGVFGYHHYHSNTHEFLGVVAGRARLQLGGPEGVELEVEAGDALVLPAGTGHKLLASDAGFRVVGAYPGGASYDMHTGEPGERPEVLETIEAVDVPDRDPLFGSEGPLRESWAEQP